MASQHNKHNLEKYTPTSAYFYPTQQPKQENQITKKKKKATIYDIAKQMSNIVDNNNLKPKCIVTKRMQAKQLKM